MSEAKQTEQWNHTAALRLDLWRIATGMSGKRRNLELSDFHPYLKPAKRKLSREETVARLNEFVGIPNGDKR